MKLVDFFQVIISTFLLVVNQIFLKFWLSNRDITVWPINLHMLKNLFSYEVLISCTSIGVSAILWMGLLKRIDFSVVYPMISLSYIFGLLAAVFIFHESVPPIRWVGVLVIIVGVFLITRS